MINGIKTVWAEHDENYGSKTYTIGTMEDFKEMKIAEAIQTTIYRFVNMSKVHRFEIMAELELDIPNWQELGDADFNHAVVEKAVEQKKTTAFVEAVDRKHKEIEG